MTMSNFTVELGTLFEEGYPLNLNDYPIYDESYRQVLNNKIINHFYLREIGAETPDRFNFYLGRKMQEIMPYYNQMYKSELLQFDPLSNSYQETIVKFMRENENISNSQNSGFSGESVTDTYTANQDTVQDYKQNGDHTQGVLGSYSKQGKSEEDSTGNTLRTDNLKENSTETSHTDNLTTNDLTEQLDETAKTDTTTTNDLTESSKGTLKSTTDTTNTANKTETFSDIPQAGITTKVLPDGTVETTGYATTQTVSTERSTGKQTVDQATTGEVKNTGTVKVNGTSEAKHTKTNTGTVDIDIDVTTTGETTNTGTQNTDTTGNIVKEWSESGNNKEDLDYTETETSKTTGNTKDDSVRKNERQGKTDNFNVSTDKSKERNQSNTIVKGRNFSPSQLLQEFRSTFLNIDMLIIDELEPLFMGLYE